MSDLDRFLADIERAITKAVYLAETGTAEIKSVTVGRVLSANISLTVRSLEELARLPGRGRKASPGPEPLVDVFDDERGLRVVILLPGVRKKDLRVLTGHRSLRIEITKGDTTYHKDIPYKIPPSRITVDSMVEKNSVVEIVFGKRRTRK